MVFLNLIKNFDEKSNFDLFYSSISFKILLLHYEIFLILKDWSHYKAFIDNFINIFNNFAPNRKVVIKIYM